MADEKYSKKKFGDTYYPITQNQMSNNRFKNFTGDKKFGSREDLDKNKKVLYLIQEVHFLQEDKC